MKTFSKTIIAALVLIGLTCCSGNHQSNNSASTSGTMKCASCGKTYTLKDTYYDSEKGYSRGCSSDHCAKCSARIAKENDRKVLQQGIKKARNTWVDNNPDEAKRRGIGKL